MWRASFLALFAAIGLSCALASSAAAKVTILDGETGAPVGQIDKTKCILKSKGASGPFRFIAFSQPANAQWTLDVWITKSAWRGYGETYTLFNGGSDVTFDLFGPGGSHFVNGSIPATPDGTLGLGAIKFSPNHRSIRIGYAAASNEDFTAGVSFAGGMKCVGKKKPR